MKVILKSKTFYYKPIVLNIVTFRNLSVKDIVLLQPPTDLALVKVDDTIDTSIYTPVCLPEKGWRAENRYKPF